MKQLQVPLWFWNSAEWSAFTQASAKTQRPTLIQALRQCAMVQWKSQSHQAMKCAAFYAPGQRDPDRAQCRTPLGQFSAPQKLL
jgi:hypothetical protein